MAQYSRLSKKENIYEKGFNYVLEAYIPLYFGDSEVFAVAEVYYGVDGLFERIARTRVAVWIITLASFLALYLLLSKIFFNASSLIIKQKEDLERTNLALEKTYLGTIKALVSAVDAKDHYTKGHSVRVAQISLLLAESLLVDDKTRFEIQQAALLHDVGKIGIDDVILKKPGRLSPEEWEIMKKHPVIGATILEEAETLSKDLINMIRSHHERFDGNGYPDGLMKDQIPLGARIIAVADAYDAMRSERPYRMAKTPEEILSEFEDASGTQFDPMVVEALFGIADQIEKVIYAASKNNMTHQFIATTRLSAE
ncbi:HDIG domain-containing protein [Calderihabitans maritimus]|uniref:HDIG domain-containing protein n=1 Tax=Calderihabitans maritimus TaxID=1246530 RepID=A0A1Z5HSY8_9FIRM|nr:HDIG domain-containing protein [Calderihabitans maritimus]